jgi:uncharacterized protein (DUF305 family)
VAALLIAVLAGCASTPAPPGTPATVGAADTAFNDTDVMFLQMGLEHIRQGAEVVRLARERGSGAEVRALAAAMDTEWSSEAAVMTGWLTGWGRPLTADPDTGVHAGHGDLHSLRPSDIEELRRSAPADFDRTALSLLIGHLHNAVEVTRLEEAGGQYPPAREMAAAMTRTRQAQIQRMLALVA